MRKFLPPLKFNQDGQVVLTVLLVMTVVLVLGLSVASRSVTDIKISQQSQESARALWVAQAGLEEAMKANASLGVDNPKILNNVEYTVTKTSLGGSREFVFPDNISADGSVSLWLVNHNESTGQIDTSGGYTGNQLTFFWGKEATLNDTTPALEATLIYYKDAVSGMLFQRYAYDPNSGRSTSTNFTSANLINTSFGGANFVFSSNTITLPAAQNLYLVRLKLLFNTNTSHPIGIRGNANLPKQGNCFDSSANIVESGVTRKMRQCQLWKTTPSIFDHVVFSGTNI